MVSEFSKRLSECLKEFDMTQRELARKLEVTEVTVSRWISGERMPSYATMDRIADVFDMPVKYFYLNTMDLCRGEMLEGGALGIGLMRPSEFKEREKKREKNTDDINITFSCLNPPKCYKPRVKEEEKKVVEKKLDWASILTSPTFNATAVIGIVALAKAMGKLTDDDAEQIKNILDR